MRIIYKRNITLIVPLAFYRMLFNIYFHNQLDEFHRKEIGRALILFLAQIKQQVFGCLKSSDMQ